MNNETDKLNLEIQVEANIPKLLFEVVGQTANEISVLIFCVFRIFMILLKKLCFQLNRLPYHKVLQSVHLLAFSQSYLPYHLVIFWVSLQCRPTKLKLNPSSQHMIFFREEIS